MGENERDDTVSRGVEPPPRGGREVFALNIGGLAFFIAALGDTTE
jgi:hypothetical protein